MTVTGKQIKITLVWFIFKKLEKKFVDSVMTIDYDTYSNSVIYVEQNCVWGGGVHWIEKIDKDIKISRLWSEDKIKTKNTEAWILISTMTTNHFE